MIPYTRQTITDEDIEAVARTLRGDYLTCGPEVDRFEASLSAEVGSRFAVACSSGTAALHLACLALDLKPNDAVFVPALTFAASANAALYCGAKPVFVDIDPKTKTMSIASLQIAISFSRKHNLNPRAIMPVHYAGLAADLTGLWPIAERERMTVISDSCHALGSTYCDLVGQVRKIGECKLEHLSCFSFHPAKHVAVGEGGAITTSDPHLASKLKMLRTHGITRTVSEYQSMEHSRTNGILNPWYHEMQVLGFNYRLPDVLAALGTSQMTRIAENIAQRQQVAKLYRAALGKLPWLTLPPEAGLETTHAYHLFPVDIDYRAVGKSRAEIMTQLSQQGIGTQVHYLPVYFHPYYQTNADKWMKVDCSVAENHYHRTLSIPMYHGLTDSQIQRVVNSLHELQDNAHS